MFRVFSSYSIHCYNLFTEHQYFRQKFFLFYKNLFHCSVGVFYDVQPMFWRCDTLTVEVVACHFCVWRIVLCRVVYAKNNIR